ncbi:hypothetical protein AB0J74_32255 [Asanoa sp. NPDC049573]|uniref:hypothetical protein n=1 Tax=Asanoa sp. NPDC049573 TaxID=3155396 RepID=UPI00342EBBFA
MRTTPLWRALAVIGAVSALVATGVAPAAAAIPSGNFDFRALGARINGAVGDQAEIKLGFRNDGPAPSDRSDSGHPVTTVDVTVPSGTTAVAVPQGCAPREGRAFRCSPGPVVAVGETITFPFTLRIDAAGAGRGSVAINVACQCDGANIDLNSGNDTAPIEINVAAETGGQPGGLPVTGATATLIAGAGGLLLVAGVVGLVIAWRHRKRFVA